MTNWPAAHYFPILFQYCALPHPWIKACASPLPGCQGASSPQAAWHLLPILMELERISSMEGQYSVAGSAKVLTGPGSMEGVPDSYLPGLFKPRLAV